MGEPNNIEFQNFSRKSAFELVLILMISAIPTLFKWLGDGGDAAFDELCRRWR